MASYKTKIADVATAGTVTAAETIAFAKYEFSQNLALGMWANGYLGDDHSGHDSAFGIAATGALLAAAALF